MHCNIVHIAIVLVLFTGGTLGCQKAEKGADEARKKGAEAVETAGEKAESGKEKVGEAMEAAGETANKTVDKVTELVGEKTKTSTGELAGRLSQSARSMLQSVTGNDTVAAMVLSGEQVAPVVADLARAADDAYDSDTTVEPIYVPVDDAEKADEAINAMPRTEVVDGVTVGLHDLTLTETDTRRSERGVLLIWRRDDHLVGFVYRSESQINIDNVVAEAPRMMELARGVLVE